QYRAAATIDTVGQTATVTPLGSGRVSDIATEFAREPWVRATALVPRMRQVCPDEANCMGISAFVSSCADLAAVFGPLSNCSDDRPAWIDGPARLIGDENSLTFAAAPPRVIPADDTPGEPAARPGPTVAVPMPT